MARKKPDPAPVKKKEEKPKPERAPGYTTGRPTKYRPEYCEALIKHMASGLSFECFGATINVARDRVYAWAKEHPEFAEAKQAALQQGLLWWEKQGNMGLWQDREGPTINTGMWIFNMKNRHRWQERHEVETKDGDLDVRSKIQALPMEELKRLVTEKLEDKE